jgi:predicted nucleic acid-binding protein
MIAYFDTSGLLPLVVEEAGSAAAVRCWEESDRLATCRLSWPEARAALGAAQRSGRLTVGQCRTAVRDLRDRFAELDVVELDSTVAEDAGALAERHALRGADAVHLAAALLLGDLDEVVVVAGDRALLGAAAARGLAVARC